MAYAISRSTSPDRYSRPAGSDHSYTLDRGEPDIAVEERGNWPTWLGLDPRLDRLRADERFVSLLCRVDTVQA